MAETTWQFTSARPWQDIGQSFRRHMTSWKAPLMYRPLTRLEFQNGFEEAEDPFAALDGLSAPKFNIVALAKHSTTGMASYLGLRLYETASGTTGRLTWEKGVGSFAKGLDDAAMASIKAVDPRVSFTRV